MDDPVTVILTGPPGPHRVKVDPAVLAATRQPGLVDQLTAAKLDFKRPAVPAVYTEYRLFLTSGRYPYLAAVEADILARYPDIPTDLHAQLRREIYLASGQYKAATMVAQEQAARADGFRPIVDFTPRDGLRLDWLGRADGPFRVTADGRGGWLLIPKGKRTNGWRWADLVTAHGNYQRAAADRQVDLNAPAVVMVREVT
jgi:hypothetical protein